MLSQREKDIRFELFNGVYGSFIALSIVVLEIVKLFADTHLPDIVFFSLFLIMAVISAISSVCLFRRGVYMFGVGAAALSVICLLVVLLNYA